MRSSLNGVTRTTQALIYEAVARATPIGTAGTPATSLSAVMAASPDRKFVILQRIDAWEAMQPAPAF
jgi:hypothetical protein